MSVPGWTGHLHGFIYVAYLLLVHLFAEFVRQPKVRALMTSDINCNSDFVTFMVF